MSTEYQWKWERGDGAHYWLRDKSNTLLRETGSRSLGLIEPLKAGWDVRLWHVNSFSEQVAVLPSTMTLKDVKAAAKIILLSLKDST